MTVDVWPVESDGKSYVEVVIDDKTNRHGPYPDSDTAGAMVRRVLQLSYTLSGGGKWAKSSI
jgi:hypothetical protein